MIDSPITRDLLEKGEIKNVGVIIPNSDGTFTPYKCRLSSWFKKGDDIIVKLKTSKDWPFGHKYIYRSLEEII